ncbi:MAG: hypothetical protein JWR33_984 [Naasia sp.]|uniref:pyrimidine reductase family protein n=1 Tax=Naasia sp. TaxID=2546198 RepID=UPI002628C14F|nr:pyrimidine reductase family protein [Naasia sp.]MCU1570243.1 hypothetical protein [Naasia sp.]
MIERLWPPPAVALSEDDIAAAYATPHGAPPAVRFNFVESSDGAATFQGRSAGLGSADDQLLLHLLRRTADVLLLGAGTVRAEGYGGELLRAADLAWRTEHGASERPAVAIVSATLDLDPWSSFFTSSLVRPIVFTTEAADPEARAAFARVAEVVICGGSTAEPHRIVQELTDRGHRRLLSEGGPRLFGAFQQAGLVHELCLTLAAALVGGPNTRIALAARENAEPVRLTLAQVLRSGDTLFLRYRVPEPGTSATAGGGRTVS